MPTQDPRRPQLMVEEQAEELRSGLDLLVSDVQKFNPQAALVLKQRIQPLMIKVNQCSMSADDTPPLSADEIKGKVLSPGHRIWNRFGLTAQSIETNVAGMGKPDGNNNTMVLFRLKKGEDGAPLGFAGTNANHWMIGPFDNEGYLPKKDLHEIRGFRFELRNADRTAPDITDVTLLDEAAVYIRSNGNDELFLGELRDFRPRRRVGPADELLEYEMRFPRALATLRGGSKDRVELLIKFHDTTIGFSKKLVGKVESIGPYYTVFGRVG